MKFDGSGDKSMMVVEEWMEKGSSVGWGKSICRKADRGDG